MSRATRRIGVLTTGRSDFGLLRPVIHALRRRAGVKVQIFVTGMHLVPRLGMTVDDVFDEFPRSMVTCVEAMLDDDSAAGVATSFGLAATGFADVLEDRPVDCMVVLGDRYETLAVVAALTPFNIPVAHLHGGEVTLGAIDDAVRHAITKLSHLHFVATAEFGRRVRQLGEEAWRVTVSGAPGLDAIRRFRPTPRRALEQLIGVPVNRQTVLLTFHPETRRPDAAERDVRAVLAAVERVASSVIVTAPNADVGREIVVRAVSDTLARNARWALVDNLGQQNYLSAMAHVGAMVGNSSSGLIEAPSFHLPVVNVGGRQGGRLRARNVIDVPASAHAIERALRKALGSPFRRSIASLQNPYGDGKAADRIATVLSTTPLDSRLIVKKFVTRGRR